MCFIHDSPDLIFYFSFCFRTRPLNPDAGAQTSGSQLVSVSSWSHQRCTLSPYAGRQAWETANRGMCKWLRWKRRRRGTGWGSVKRLGFHFFQTRLLEVQPLFSLRREQRRKQINSASSVQFNLKVADSKGLRCVFSLNTGSLRSSVHTNGRGKIGVVETCMIL